MKISYVSDLHLEFLDYPDFSKEEGGDVLILAGDITTANMLRLGRTDQHNRSQRKYLLERFKPLLDKYSHIFYVMGNHEHYGSNFVETKKLLQEAFADLGLPIQIFDNEYQLFNGWLFLGATLWTDFNQRNPLFMSLAQAGMNDYRLIGAEIGSYDRGFTRSITPEFTAQEHALSLQYFSRIIKDLNIENVLVFTHMAPSYRSLNRQHSGNGLDYAYASNLTDFIFRHSQIKYWIHGHTHMNVNYMVGDCNILANQRGYSGEDCHARFKGLAHIEV